MDRQIERCDRSGPQERPPVGSAGAERLQSSSASAGIRHRRLFW